MRRSINIKWIVLIGLPIIMWKFYWYVGFKQEYTKLLNFVVSFLLLAIVGFDIVRTKGRGYERYVRWIIAFFLVSIMTSFIYWGQSPSLSFRAGSTVLMMLYFFVLKKYNVSESELIRLIFIFAGIYTVLWLYALSQAPNVVFGSLEEISDDRGFYRIMQLKSIDTVCVLYFISLVHAITQSEKYKWIIITVVCFLVLFLSLTRMLVFSITIVTAVFLLRKRFILAVFASAVLIVGYEQLTNNDIVSNMINMTERQITGQEDNDLRMTEYSNAFTAFPFHVGTTIFGNGSPHPQSSYGIYNENLKSTLGFNISDAGYVGIYVEYGIAMLALLLLLLSKVIKDKVPIPFQPYKLYIIALFIVSLTSYSFWGHGISFSIALYALSIAETKKSNNEYKEIIES